MTARVRKNDFEPISDSSVKTRMISMFVVHSWWLQRMNLVTRTVPLVASAKQEFSAGAAGESV